MDNICEPCDYTTKIKYNFVLHFQTVKHIKNMEIFNKQKMEDLIAQNKESADEIKELKNQIAILTSENKSLIEYKEIMKETQKTSTGTVNYIINNFAPPPIKKYKLLEYSNAMKTLDIIDTDDDPKFIKKIVYNSTKKILPKFLGDIIVKLYKKKDLKDQSMFNSDVSRLSYIIREKHGDENLWTQDKSGILVTQYVIQPYLKYISDLLHKAVNKLTEENALNPKMTANKLCKNNDTIKCYLDISHSIDNKILEGEINKYIAPFFYYKHKVKPNLLIKE